MSSAATASSRNAPVRPQERPGRPLGYQGMSGPYRGQRPPPDPVYAEVLAVLAGTQGAMVTLPRAHVLYILEGRRIGVGE